MTAVQEDTSGLKCRKKSLVTTKESCPKVPTGLNLMKNALTQQRYLQRIVRTVQQRKKYHFRIQVARPNVLAKPKMTSPTDTEVMSPLIRDTTLHSVGPSSPHPLVGDVVCSRKMQNSHVLELEFLEL